MKILYYNGYNPEEKLEFIPAIHCNIYESIQNVIRASEALQMPFIDEKTIAIAELFSSPFSNRLSPELAVKIEEFWNDDVVLKIMERRAEFQLLDNTQYYALNIKRICEMDYVPSDEDILNSRVQTTGVTETTFMMKGKKFVLVDVGGQRSERKKWIHCFENVSGVLFCIAISEYDQTLYEDNVTNRMHEALKLFHEICTSKWFSNTSIVLFLNKSDLFKRKLASVKSISIAFPEFKHDCDYDESIDFLVKIFITVKDPITQRNRQIYHHVTNAIDTENIKIVFGAVRDFVINEALRRSGML